MKKDANYWIQKLDLKKHPEGGYFKEVYRSNENAIKACLPERFNGNRSFSTSIYFLLKGNQFSAFHRIKSDEIWHYYDGDTSVTIYFIDKAGVLHKRLLGKDAENNEFPQQTIPAETWFAAKLNNPNSFALVGCTVSPGFDFNDFELAEKKDLTNSYPQHKEIINSFFY